MYLHLLCALVGSICLLEVKCLHADTTQLNYVRTEPLTRAVVTLPRLSGNAYYKILDVTDKKTKKNKTPSDTCEYVNKAIGFSERKDRNSSKRKLASEVFKRGQMFSCLTGAPDKANSSDCLD